MDRSFTSYPFRALAGAAVAAALLLSVPARAVDIPPLLEVPAPLAAAHPELALQRTTLLEKRAELRERTRQQNTRCGHLEENSPDVGPCEHDLAALSGDVGRHVDASNAFNKAVAQHKAELRAALQGEIAQARARIKADQEQFRRLRLDTVSDAFETWSKLTDDERSKFERALTISAISQGLTLIKMGTYPVGSFTPPQANALITYLRDSGVNEPFLEDGLRNVAMTAGKPAMAAAVREFADDMQRGLAGGGALSKLPDDKLGALAAVLGAFVKSPELRAARTFGETLVNFYFAEKAMGVIEVDMNRVINLPDAELASVDRLSAQMKTDVGRLNRLSRDLTLLGT